MTCTPGATDKRIGLVIDLDTCVGCQGCVTAVTKAVQRLDPGATVDVDWTTDACTSTLGLRASRWPRP